MSDIRRLGDADAGCSNDERFKAELEFVQCLASPQYINCEPEASQAPPLLIPKKPGTPEWRRYTGSGLAQNRYFEDASFIAYLDYLKYWRRPEYSTYILYPHCLYFLDLLSNKEFRANMASNNAKELMHSQQLFFYQHYRNNRLKQTAAGSGTA